VFLTSKHSENIPETILTCYFQLLLDLGAINHSFNLVKELLLAPKAHYVKTQKKPASIDTNAFDFLLDLVFEYNPM